MRDRVLAATLVVTGVLELFTTYAWERQPRVGPDALYAAVFAATAAALAWRLIAPLLVAPFVAGTYAVLATGWAWPNVYTPVLVLGISMYSLLAYAPTQRAGLVVGGVTLLLSIPIGLADAEDPIGTAATTVILDVAVGATGMVVRRQRARADSATIARRQAERQVREIAASERARIARELHDVVAHGMSVVVLQARGGRRVQTSDPVSARRAFDDIEQVASECLDEMRRLLGILRGGDDAPLTPQPTLQELDGLVAQACASGADVCLVVEGEQRPLPPAVELSVFRIAQEALTNSLKHASGSRTELRLIYEDDAVSVVAMDDGPGGPVKESGHGLIGMRERVELFGGTLELGTGPEGGFAVHARLPLAEAMT